MSLKVDTHLQRIVRRMRVQPVPSMPGQDTCEGCCFDDSLLCMGTIDCQDIIFKLNPQQVLC